MPGYLSIVVSVTGASWLASDRAQQQQRYHISPLGVGTGRGRRQPAPTGPHDNRLLIEQGQDMTLVAERAHELASDIGEVSAVGWHGPAGMEFDEWVRIGNTLQQVGNSINWWVGDWLNYGEAKWGEMYAQAIEITGWEYQRLANAKLISAQIQFSLRQEKLSYSHHVEVAKLPHEKQHYWLQRAYTENMRVRELRDAIRQSQLPPPAPVDDDVPFSSASPRIAPPVTNGNGYHAPVDEYEQAAEVWQESNDGYDWTDPEP